MGQALVDQILPALARLQWPPNTQATLQGKKTFEVGLDKVDEFRGDPKVLGAALRVLQTSNSQPYAFAGVAYVLLAAAREDNGHYAQSGLEAALLWLEKAQETEPDIPEINVIEALIYIYGQRLDDARLVLDYLTRQNAANYYLYRAETHYWQAREEPEQALVWCQKAMGIAPTLPQRLRLQSVLGDLLLASNNLDAAVTTYQEALHFDNSNYLLWHNLSVAYWKQGNYDDAARSNQRALALQDFPAGQEMAAALKQKLGGSKGLVNRLLGR